MIINDETDLERMQADGTVSVDDADEIRTFMAFLEDVGPKRERLRQAYAKHYPEEYAQTRVDAIAAKQRAQLHGLRRMVRS